MLYIARHGESDYNAKGVSQGQLDEPVLTQHGQLQASILRDFLVHQNCEFNRVICSDLRRAKQTWEIIKTGVTHKHFDFDIRLREKDQGELTGLSYEDPKWKHYQNELKNGEPNLSAFNPQPESPTNFRQRALEVLKSLEGHGNTLIITHGGIIRNIHAILLQIPLQHYLLDEKKFQIGNASLMTADLQTHGHKITVFTQAQMKKLIEHD